MKVLNKIKSIYLLAIVAILSFCMLLFPAMPKTASATDSSESVSITGARVILQKYGSGENVSERWATMFQAEITSYVEGSEYGMIIGPKAAYDSAVENSKANYADLVAEYAFVDKVSQTFEDDGTTKSYWAGIVYDAGALDSATLAKRASMELAAIPYVKTDDSVVLGVGGTAVPRNYLVSTHLDQQEAIQENPEAEIDGKPIEATSVAKWVGGEFNVYDGDAYICQSTNKFYVGAKGSELEAINVLANGGEVVVDNKALGADAVDSTGFKADYVSALPDFGGVDYVVYGENGATVYSAKVAERVIMRFADKVIGSSTTDTTQDYLATTATSNYISYYKSIFYIADANNWMAYRVDTKVNGAPAYQGTAQDYYAYAMDNKYDGLYVLGANISITSNHEYRWNDFQMRVLAGAALTHPAVRPLSDADTSTLRKVAVIPTANAGFVGTFDGRGLYFDTNAKATTGVFPSAYGATIENTAFLNLYSGYKGSGIVSRAARTTFENIYATVSSVNAAPGDANDGILMTLDNCTLNNFVVEVDTINDTVMTQDLVMASAGSSAAGSEDRIVMPNTAGTATVYAGIVGNSGAGNGKITAGVFNFTKYFDAYRDETNNCTRVMMNIGQHQASFSQNATEEQIKEWFPHLVKADGTINLASATTTSSGRYGGVNPTGSSDVFYGTKGTNVYVVGSSPLYVNHDFASEHTQGATLGANAQTTVFVNEAIEYYKDGDSVKTKVNPLGNDYTDASANPIIWYTISELVDADGNVNKLFAIDDTDDYYSLGEIILRGKMYIHGETRMSRLISEGTAAEDVLKVRVVNKAGWYDVADYEEMATYVNANTGAQFNADFWNVVDGVVSWRVLPA